MKTERASVAVYCLPFNPVSSLEEPTRKISCKPFNNGGGEELNVTRKLIRTTLAEVKGRETTDRPRERPEGPPSSRPEPRRMGGDRDRERSSSGPRESSGARDSSAAALGRKKIPPSETNAEI